MKWKVKRTEQVQVWWRKNGTKVMDVTNEEKQSFQHTLEQEGRLWTWKAFLSSKGKHFNIFFPSFCTVSELVWHLHQWTRWMLDILLPQQSFLSCARSYSHFPETGFWKFITSLKTEFTQVWVNLSSHSMNIIDTIRHQSPQFPLLHPQIHIYIHIYFSPQIHPSSEFLKN